MPRSRRRPRDPRRDRRRRPPGRRVRPGRRRTPRDGDLRLHADRSGGSSTAAREPCGSRSSSARPARTPGAWARKLALLHTPKDYGVPLRGGPEGLAVPEPRDRARRRCSPARASRGRSSSRGIRGCRRRRRERGTRAAPGRAGRRGRAAPDPPAARGAAVVGRTSRGLPVRGRPRDDRGSRSRSTGRSRG